VWIFGRYYSKVEGIGSIGVWKVGDVAQRLKLKKVVRVGVVKVTNFEVRRRRCCSVNDSKRGGERGAAQRISVRRTRTSRTV
jgi:hypothetical protein